MATDKNIVKDVEESYDEANSAENGLLSEIETDDQYYMGKQMNQDDLIYMKNKNIPDITINKVQKPVNLVTGYYRQNQLDLKYYPIEGSDTEMADIYTELSKWTMTMRGGNDSKSIAFGDATRGGLGWLKIEMDYTNDPLYGDPVVGFEDKYHIMFDPYMKSPNPNEDCDYQLRYAWLNKDKAIQLYPDSEREIKSLKSGRSSTFFNIQNPSDSVSDRSSRINVIEKWYKKYVAKTIMIDPISFESYEWKGGNRRLKQLKEQRPDLMGNVQVVDVKVPKIKLIAVAEDKILLYDDYPPEGFSDNLFPFIPMFSYYLPNFNDWALKVFGIIRSMRPAQKEYNKMRSIMMEIAMSQPYGWKYEVGAVENPAELDKTGARQKIEVRPNKLLERLEGGQISDQLSQLHQMHHDDLTEVGPNPDLLGMVGSGGSATDVSGITLKLRKDQGMMTLQNPFDGAALAHKAVGRYLVEMYNRWPKEKIQRIIGRQVPQDWDKRKMSSRFDCTIDEQSSSPTYQMATLATMMSMNEHGTVVPPMVMREYFNIPQKLKDSWAAEEAQLMQQQQQQRQEELKMRIMEMGIKSKADMDKTLAQIQGDKDVTAMKIESDEKIEMEKLMQGLALSKMDENMINKQMRIKDREYK